MIKLLLADDQALVRGALAALLGLEPDLEVVAEVGRGDEVLAAVERTHPDVALLDVEMPGLEGISAATQLHAAHPEVRILMVTTFGRPGYLRRAIDAGASGFVVKDTRPRTGRRSPPRPPGPARGRPGPGHRNPHHRNLPPHRPRTRSPGRGLRRRHRRSHSENPAPLRRHSPQPPLRRNRQNRHQNSRRSRPHRRTPRLALTPEVKMRRPGTGGGGYTRNAATSSR